MDCRPIAKICRGANVPQQLHCAQVCIFQPFRLLSHCNSTPEDRKINRTDDQVRILKDQIRVTYLNKNHSIYLKRIHENICKLYRKWTEYVYRHLQNFAPERHVVSTVVSVPAPISRQPHIACVMHNAISIQSNLVA